MRYRTIPIYVEAMRMSGTTVEKHRVYQWVERNTEGSFDINDPYLKVPASGVSIDAETGLMVVITQKGPREVNHDDYVIKHPNGEFSVCKPDVFRKTYEEI